MPLSVEPEPLLEEQYGVMADATLMPQYSPPPPPFNATAWTTHNAFDQQPWVTICPSLLADEQVDVAGAYPHHATPMHDEEVASASFLDLFEPLTDATALYNDLMEWNSSSSEPDSEAPSAYSFPHSPASSAYTTPSPPSPPPVDQPSMDFCTQLERLTVTSSTSIGPLPVVGGSITGPTGGLSTSVQNSFPSSTQAPPAPTRRSRKTRSSAPKDSSARRHKQAKQSTALTIPSQRRPRRVHPPGNVCLICGHKSPNPSTLEKHMYTHCDPSFQCPGCVKRYCQPWALQRHIRTEWRYCGPYVDTRLWTTCMRAFKLEL